MKTLKSAVIGVGYLGRFHAQKYKALESEMQVQLVGVCDLNPEQSQKVATELGVQSFSNPEDLIGKIDVVSIATVTQTHYQVAKMMLNAGIHVLVEKPMTVSVDEAAELVALAKAKNLKLAVGHSERFNPAFVKAHELVPQPRMVELLRHAPYKTRGADVSVVHDLMVHDLDLLMLLAPGPLHLTSAQGGALISPTVDWSSASFRFGEGQTGFISVSRVAGAMTRSMRLIGDKISVWADLQTGDLQVSRYESGVQESGVQESGVQESPQLSSETIAVGKGDNLLIETRAFLNLVQGKESGIATGEQGMIAMKWIIDIVKLMGPPL